MSKDEAAAVEGWYELDNGAVVARMNFSRGYFVLPVGGKAWEWLPYDSDDWNAIDQLIRRQLKYQELQGPPPSAPALPTPPRPTRAVDRDEPGDYGRNERFLEWVSAGPEGRRTAFLVLEEDPYESFFGDGLYRYSVDCVPNEEAAEKLTVRDGVRKHVRRIDLWVEGHRLRARGERRDFADRYLMKDVLGLLAAHLFGTSQ